MVIYKAKDCKEKGAPLIVKDACLHKENWKKLQGSKSRRYVSGPIFCKVLCWGSRLFRVSNTMQLSKKQPCRVAMKYGTVPVRVTEMFNEKQIEEKNRSLRAQ